MNNTAICTIMKDEKLSHIKEWIDYHFKLGFNHIYIYDDHSKQPLSVLLYSQPNVTVISQIPDVDNRQKYVDEHFLETYKQDNKWVAFIDLDEFIVPRDLDANINDIMLEYEDFGGLGINWVMFGNSDVVRSPETVLNTFLQRSDFSYYVNHHIKTIANVSRIAEFINPHCFKYTDNYKCVNTKKDIIPQHSNEPGCFDKIVLHHYYRKSYEDYINKCARGRCDMKSNGYELNDWRTDDLYTNLIHDTSAIEFYERHNAE